MLGFEFFGVDSEWGSESAADSDECGPFGVETAVESADGAPGGVYVEHCHEEQGTAETEFRRMISSCSESDPDVTRTRNETDMIDRTSHDIRNNTA